MNLNKINVNTVLKMVQSKNALLDIKIGMLFIMNDLSYIQEEFKLFEN